MVSLCVDLGCLIYQCGIYNLIFVTFKQCSVHLICFKWYFGRSPLFLVKEDEKWIEGDLIRAVTSVKKETGVGEDCHVKEKQEKSWRQ